MESGFLNNQIIPVVIPATKKTPEIVIDKDEHPRPQTTAEDGQIVVARIGDEATVKRYLKEPDGTVVFMPENEDFDPIYPENPSILGKVIGSYRRY